MRGLAIAILAVTVLALPATGLARAADVAQDQRLDAAYQAAVDDNDDTRVEVQLVVVGAAIGLVVVGGTVAYLVRRRLGLVAPPPEPGSDAHH